MEQYDLGIIEEEDKDGSSRRGDDDDKGFPLSIQSEDAINVSVADLATRRPSYSLYG